MCRFLTWEKSSLQVLHPSFVLKYFKIFPGCFKRRRRKSLDQGSQKAPSGSSRGAWGWQSQEAALTLQLRCVSSESEGFA